MICSSWLLLWHWTEDILMHEGRFVPIMFCIILGRSFPMWQSKIHLLINHSFALLHPIHIEIKSKMLLKLPVYSGLLISNNFFLCVTKVHCHAKWVLYFNSLTNFAISPNMFYLANLISMGLWVVTFVSLKKQLCMSIILAFNVSFIMLWINNF